MVQTKLVLVAFFWASLFIVGETTVKNLDPLYIALIRFALSSLILFLFLYLKDKSLLILNRSNLLPLMCLGFVGVSLYNAFFFMGLKESGAIKSSIIIASIPVFTALLSSKVNKDKITLAIVVKIALSIVGVMLVITNGNWDFWMSISIGDFWLISCVLSWSIYTTYGKKYMTDVSPVVFTFYTAFFGTLVLIPISLVWAQGTVAPSSFETMLAVAYMAIFATVIAFFWWNQGAKEIGPAKTALFLNLVPVFTLSLSCYRGNVPSVIQIAGAVLIILGVSLGNIRIPRKFYRSV